MKRYFSPQERPSQRGAATLMIVLIAVIVATMAVAALAIAPQLKRITEERQTVKRAEVIVDAIKQYFLARGELPGNSPIPVSELGLSQEYKFDTWGREWIYYKGATINAVTVNGIDGQAGYLVSRGPNQELETFPESSSPLPDDITRAGDDIVIPLNVQAEAIQLTWDGLRALRLCPDDPSHLDTNNVITNVYLNHIGLGDAFGRDPWSDPNEFNIRWVQLSGGGNWVSAGPPGGNQPIRGPFVSCPEGDSVPDPDHIWDAEDAASGAVGDTPGYSEGANQAYDFSADTEVDTEFNPNTSLQDTSFTLSFWAKPLTANIPNNPANQWQVVLGAWQNNNTRFAIGIGNNRWYWELGNSDRYSILPNHIYNYWQHIVLVYDYGDGTNKRVRFFLNGALVDDVAYGGNSQWPNTSLFLGRQSFSGGGQARYFNGYVDDAAIWYQPLSEEQVWLLYWKTTVARYLFHGDGRDASPWENHGTFMEDETPWAAPSFVHDRFDEAGQAVEFNGTNQWMDMGTHGSLDFGQNNNDPNLIESGFSVAAWFKTTDSFGPLVSFRNSTHGGAVIDLTVGFDGAVTSSGDIMGLVREDNQETGAFARTAGGPVAEDQWHYAVLVRDQGNNIRLYLDGAQADIGSGLDADGSITSNLRALASERRWVQDGYGSPDQRWFAGTLDEVVIYPRNISVNEIHDEWCRFKTDTGVSYGATCP